MGSAVFAKIEECLRLGIALVPDEAGIEQQLIRGLKKAEDLELFHRDQWMGPRPPGAFRIGKRKIESVWTTRVQTKLRIEFITCDKWMYDTHWNEDEGLIIDKEENHAEELRRRDRRWASEDWRGMLDLAYRGGWLR